MVIKNESLSSVKTIDLPVLIHFGTIKNLPSHSLTYYSDVVNAGVQFELEIHLSMSSCQPTGEKYEQKSISKVNTEL